MHPKRGDLYFFEVPQEYRGKHEDYGPHMHVVVSREEINNDGKIVAVVPLTSPIGKDGKPKDVGLWRFSRIRIPSNQKIWESDSPHTQQGDSLAKTEQIFCVTQDVLGTRCGKLPPDALGSLEPGMAFVLDIPTMSSAAKALGNPGKAIRPPIKPSSQ